MTMRELTLWLASLPLRPVLRRTSWAIPGLQTLHILSLGALVASIEMLDLRIFDYARSGHRRKHGAGLAGHPVVSESDGERRGRPMRRRIELGLYRNPDAAHDRGGDGVWPDGDRRSAAPRPDLAQDRRHRPLPRRDALD